MGLERVVGSRARQTLFSRGDSGEGPVTNEVKVDEERFLGRVFYVFFALWEAV